MMYDISGSIIAAAAAAAMVCFMRILLLEKLVSEAHIISIVLKIFTGSVIAESFLILPLEIDTIILYTELRRSVAESAAMGRFPAAMVFLTLMMLLLQVVLDFVLEKHHNSWIVIGNLLHLLILIYESIFHPSGFIVFYGILVLLELLVFVRKSARSV